MVTIPKLSGLYVSFLSFSGEVGGEGEGLGEGDKTEKA